MSLWEAGMMICFGASWPMSLWRLWRTKHAGGMSLRFLSLIAVGYLCGIAHKIGNSLDWVMGLYLLNLVMVVAAIALVLQYRRNKGGEACE